MSLEMKVGERTLRFRFTVRAWLEIEEKVGSLSKLFKRFEEDDRPLAASIALAAACATAGEKHAGGSETITEEYLIESLSPKQMKNANALARRALTVGMHRETAEQDDEPVDAVLEELKKKVTPEATE